MTTWPGCWAWTTRPCITCKGTCCSASRRSSGCNPWRSVKQLFDRVYGKDAVADEAVFRAKVKEGLEGMFSRDSDRMFKRLVMKKLAEDAKFELPDSFLKRWIPGDQRKTHYTGRGGGGLRPAMRTA